MKGRLIAAVVWAAVASPSSGCVLQESSGGVAASGPGAAGGDGHDGDAQDGPDGADDLPVQADAGQTPDAGVDAGADLEADASGGGDGGPSDGGGAESGGLHCSALPFGCVCSPTEPSQVGACNTGSVIAASGQRSVCCNNPYNCICVAYECVRTNGSSCSCQLAAATAEGTRVDDCGTVSASPAIKCCRSYGQCVCSTLDCLPIETQVSNCNLTDLLTCDVGNDSVSACEPAGTTGQPRG